MLTLSKFIFSARANNHYRDNRDLSANRSVMSGVSVAQFFWKMLLEWPCNRAMNELIYLHIAIQVCQIYKSGQI